MIKTCILILSLYFVSKLQSGSKIHFENKDLEREAKTYVKKLEKCDLIFSVLVESSIFQDSLIVSFANAYPKEDSVKAYAKFMGYNFCFCGKLPLKGYYSVINPDPVPIELKEAFEKIRRGGAINYEAYSKYVIFYKGKFIRSDEWNSPDEEISN